MTTSSTLSRERLEELEDQWNCEGCIAYDDMLALIAQAMRTEQAERERDALGEERDALREILTRWYDWESEPFSSPDQQILVADTREAIHDGAPKYLIELRAERDAWKDKTLALQAWVALLAEDEPASDPRWEQLGHFAYEQATKIVAAIRDDYAYAALAEPDAGGDA